ncbi:MAG: hypothetical protein CMD68_01935 [Gammaproteobacteria bacterium]|nr:hypothetical protein [Gammaproteobacteria bacterium]|tara:strand:- start:1671 stop:1967 length:297 start_codon:yes stop_codon:yes gene_type:complete
MNNKKLNFNKSDLIYSLSRKLKLAETSANEYLDFLLDEIITNVALEKKIEIRGFGVFSKKYIRPRKFINPKTKLVSYVGETATIHFKPSKKLLNKSEK